MEVEDRYSEFATWHCRNLSNGLITRVNGALAFVLKKYPKDFELTFIGFDKGVINNELAE